MLKGMKKRSLGLTLFLGVCLITGCLTLGTDFSVDVDGWIKIDKTTQSQVSRRLGIPNELGSSSGVKVWTYYYIHHIPFYETHRKELRIYWNRNLTVKSYNLTVTQDNRDEASFSESKNESKSPVPAPSSSKPSS